jgi:hypothetical protein
MHRRSVSDSNYESLYLGDNKEEYEGSMGHGSSNHAESAPHDGLRVLNYLEDDKLESNESDVHVEKKLDFYMGARDLGNERNLAERSDAPAVNPTVAKNVSAPPGIRGEMFNGDVGNNFSHYQNLDLLKKIILLPGLTHRTIQKQQTQFLQYQSNTMVFHHNQK